MSGLILSAMIALTADAPAKRPNIVFIMTDDHAAHAMSCYGSRINTTPNLDRLAREGMRFTHCFCTNSICGPSRATILTGVYSHLNGFRDNHSKFDGKQETLAKLLKASGYQTAIVGKWHLVSEPTGFDHWEVLPGQGIYHDPNFLLPGKKHRRKGYVTDVITDLAIDYLNGRDKEKPFFLMVHHKAPHREWQPDAKHQKLYEDVDVPAPATFDDDYRGRSDAAKEAKMTVAGDLTPTDLKVPPPAGLTAEQRKHWNYQRYIKDYLRCVASVDDNVGRLLDHLDKTGLAENTIVVYTSDQGFYLGDHGWYDKRFMYEPSLRMPLLIRYPKEIAANSVVDEMVLNLDFAPTFMDFAGLTPTQRMQGKSFRPILQGKPPADWRTSMFYRYYEFPMPHNVQPHLGVRTGTHKLIYYPRIRQWELFDLKRDPDEMQSYYDDPAYEKIRTDLLAELQRLRKEFKDVDPAPGLDGG
jgi:arylsulfatase A-like enzyme